VIGDEQGFPAILQLDRQLVGPRGTGGRSGGRNGRGCQGAGRRGHAGERPQAESEILIDPVPLGPLQLGKRLVGLAIALKFRQENRFAAAGARFGKPGLVNERRAQEHGKDGHLPRRLALQDSRHLLLEDELGVEEILRDQEDGDLGLSQSLFDLPLPVVATLQPGIRPSGEQSVALQGTQEALKLLERLLILVAVADEDLRSRQAVRLPRLASGKLSLPYLLEIAKAGPADRSEGVSKVPSLPELSALQKPHPRSLSS